MNDQSSTLARSPAATDTLAQQQIFDSLQLPILALDGDLQVQHCNAAFTQLLNHSLPDLVGQPAPALFAQFTQAISQALYQEVLQTGEPRETEGWFGRRYLRTRVYRTPTGLISIVTDITERRLAEEANERQAKRFVTLYHASQEIAASLEIEEVYAATHRAVSQLMPAEVFFIALAEAGQSEIEDVYWYDRARLPNRRVPLNRTSLRAQTLQTGTALRVDDLAEQPAETLGDEFDHPPQVRAILMVPLRSGPQVIGVISAQAYAPTVYTEEHLQLLSALANPLATAIEKAQLVRSLRKNAQELETVARVSTAASTLLNIEELLNTAVNLTQTGFNLYHVQVFLYEAPEEQLRFAAGSGEIGEQQRARGGPPPYSMHAAALVAEAARTRAAVLVNNTPAAPNFVWQTAVPETRAELALPLLVGEQLLGVLDVHAREVNRFTSQDVRIQTTLAAQIAAALQNAQLYAIQASTVSQLRELNHLKSSFLSNMSHELRTPLNSILGFTDVLVEGVDGPVTPAMENDLNIIRRNGQHLLNLINEILDMAKIEAGRMTLNPEYLDFVQVLQEVTDMTRSLARAKNLYINMEVGEAQMPIEADPLRLRQIVLNLVNNSIKFTSKGGISLRAERQGEIIRLTVRDTGIGIPPAQLERIFEAFTQVDTSTTRKFSGTGLGLPISRHLVEMHGGRLWAESANVPGEGSVFYAEMPVLTTYRR